MSLGPRVPGRGREAGNNGVGARHGRGDRNARILNPADAPPLTDQRDTAGADLLELLEAATNSDRQQPWHGESVPVGRTSIQPTILGWRNGVVRSIGPPAAPVPSVEGPAVPTPIS
ncbi:hypothetical protein HEK616_82350 (plasmid) [Streptomyces nigrescens]|uniref:Uncharacterized protein n=1 Tax=Streptomyces nigrescens TaxID=1920 RepID=A0ABM8A7X3_STRNI|nr:hypothetical protein HEK616_82350 [Streptomyces nigrescens]